MKKISTAGAEQTKNCQEQKLTIGLDLGDRSSWYCVLDEAGRSSIGIKGEHDSESHERCVRGMPRGRIASRYEPCMKAKVYLRTISLSTPSCNKAFSPTNKERVKAWATRSQAQSRVS